ncbi:MAG: hypothetical protein HC788_06175 [Sphingopyxis sp.]|nr:hypothetical protein [Sphingopyxis sp.]
MLFSAMGIEGLARKVGIAVAFVLIEGGLLGFEAVDYYARWRQQRDELERAVAGRAPLPLDPGKARPPRSWKLMAQYAIGVIAVFLYFAMHADTGLTGWIDWNYLVLLVPLAYLLFFAGKLADYIAHKNLRRP